MAGRAGVKSSRIRVNSGAFRQDGKGPIMSPKAKGVFGDNHCRVATRLSPDRQSGG
jgi:hypothetical protein